MRKGREGEAFPPLKRGRAGEEGEGIDRRERKRGRPPEVEADEVDVRGVCQVRGVKFVVDACEANGAAEGKEEEQECKTREAPSERRGGREGGRTRCCRNSRNTYTSSVSKASTAAATSGMHARRALYKSLFYSKETY